MVIIDEAFLNLLCALLKQSLSPWKAISSLGSFQYLGKLTFWSCCCCCCCTLPAAGESGTMIFVTVGPWVVWTVPK